MEWARTLRIDGAPEDARQRLNSLAAVEGVRVRCETDPVAGRTYALVQAPDSVEPAELQTLASGRWYDEAIIALAIEPQPSDALQHLARALCAKGAPAGVLDAHATAGILVLEVSPRTRPELVLAFVDTELRRWNGTRRTSLLAPLPDDVLAALASTGLNAPEIAPDRILESLLGAGNVA